jgi:hypothetical protein
MEELVLDTSLREAAALVGLGHEALRKFINGTTERPHLRSLRAMGNLYLARKKLRVAEVRTAPTAGHLKLILPRGLDASTEAVQGVFDAWREGRKPPALAYDLEKWLKDKLREEYAAETNWAPRRKRSRK